MADNKSYTEILNAAFDDTTSAFRLSDSGNGIPVSTSDVHVPASGVAAVVTYTAVSGASHVISGVAWSYNTDPTGGNLKIEDGSGNTVFSVDVTSKGPGFFIFPRPKKGTANTALIITLANGGASVTGKVSVLAHWTE